MAKRIVVAGATGLIGKMLCEELVRRGYEVNIVTRDIALAKQSLPQAKDYIAWSDKDRLEKVINGAYGIINLAGAPIVGKRWNKNYKKVLLDSRIKTTKSIIEAIQKAQTKPQVLISGSAVGYYGIIPAASGYDESDLPGSDFLAQVCIAWEKEAQQAEHFGTRVVCIRTAIVLDRHEGALPRILTPFRFYIGGPIGTGRQWFPWIHVKDEIGIICFALENEKIRGPINAVAPEIITNKQFATMIGEVLYKPSVIPIPQFVLKIFFGEAATVLTTGVKVSSQKISNLGYSFQFPTLQKALEHILR